VLHLDFNDRQVDLVAEGFDLAIRIAKLGDSTLKARKLVDISRVLCASPAYLQTHGVPTTPSALKQHQILHYANSDSGTWQFVTPGGGRSSVHLPAKMVSNNGDFLCQAALDDHGIILAPSFIVWEALKAKKLVPLLCGHRPEALSAYAVYPQTRHLTERVRRLIDTLATALKDQPHWDAPAV